jgi:hypothetical protein
VSNGFWGPDFIVAPEPGTLLLLLTGSGLAALAAILRRRTKA